MTGAKKSGQLPCLLNKEASTNDCGTCLFPAVFPEFFQNSGFRGQWFRVWGLGSRVWDFFNATFALRLQSDFGDYGSGLAWSFRRLGVWGLRALGVRGSSFRAWRMKPQQTRPAFARNAGSLQKQGPRYFAGHRRITALSEVHKRILRS